MAGTKMSPARSNPKTIGVERRNAIPRKFCHGRRSIPATLPSIGQSERTVGRSRSVGRAAIAWSTTSTNATEWSVEGKGYGK